MAFQENLRKYREAAGWKYARDFADHVGIKYSTYIGYETQNREPKYEVLIQIAKALGVTTDDLLGYHPDELQKALADLKSCGLFIGDIDPDVVKKKEIDLVLQFNVEFSSKWVKKKIPSELSVKLEQKELIDLYHEVINSEKYKAMKKNLYIETIIRIYQVYINAIHNVNDKEKKESNKEP